MRRAHRRTHAVLWMILTPLLIAIVVVAARSRTDAPITHFTDAAQHGEGQ